MFSTKVQDAINVQINNELSSSYSYLAMSIYCDRENLLGCSKWLRIQSEEEYGHAMRLLDFLLARDGEAKLQAVAEPPAKFKSVAQVFEQALEQEQRVSKQIDDLYELTLKERAFAALVEMQWFITEQVEEERTTRNRGQVQPGQGRPGRHPVDRPRAGRPRPRRNQRPADHLRRFRSCEAPNAKKARRTFRRNDSDLDELRAFWRLSVTSV